MSNTYCIFEAHTPLQGNQSKKDLDQYLLAAPHSEILQHIADDFQLGTNRPQGNHEIRVREDLFFDSAELLEYVDEENYFTEQLLDFTVEDDHAIWNVWEDNIECTIPKYACWLINKEFGTDANLFVVERYMSLYDCSRNCYSVDPFTKVIC